MYNARMRLALEEWAESVGDVGEAIYFWPLERFGFAIWLLWWPLGLVLGIFAPLLGIPVAIRRGALDALAHDV